MDIKLDDTGDIDISTGDFQLLDGVEAIAQHLRIRLRFFLGEWFLDQRVGIPYFQRIFVDKPGPDAALLAAIFRPTILGTPGVISADQLTFDFDALIRLLGIDFSAQTTEGPLEFTEEFILPL